MEMIERLYDEAAEAGIRVCCGDLPIDGMNAAYVKTESDKKLIYMQRDGTQAERTCWMAEELGHHETGDDRVLRYDTVADWKAEAKARRWAHDRLLSRDSILTAAQNTDDIYEIAFTLGVSVVFLREAIDDLMARGLWATANDLG